MKQKNRVRVGIGISAKSDQDIETGILKALNSGALIQNYNDKRLDKNLPVFLPKTDDYFPSDNKYE